LNGIGTAHIPKSIDKVSFTNLEGKLHATTVLESRYERRIAEYKLLDAIRIFNETIPKLGFIYKVKITLSGNGYVIKRLFPHKHPYFTCKLSTVSYSINIDHAKLSDRINQLKPGMSPVLNKALAYYQAALESENPYIKTILLVSCISSIIKDENNIREDISRGDLVKYLDKVRKIKRMKKDYFRKLINYIYDHRSRPAHGNIDIKDRVMLGEIVPYYKKFNEIVDNYIEQFLERYVSE
jgi:hypothetical protein